jgi:hypothetical protein
MLRIPRGWMGRHDYDEDEYSSWLQLNFILYRGLCAEPKVTFTYKGFTFDSSVVYKFDEIQNVYDSQCEKCNLSLKN